MNNKTLTFRVDELAATFSIRFYCLFGGQWNWLAKNPKLGLRPQTCVFFTPTNTSVLDPEMTDDAPAKSCRQLIGNAQYKTDNSFPI